MINYELALKLKEAGFPQEYKKREIWCDFAYDDTQELHMLHEDNDTNWWLGNDYERRDMSQEEMLRDWVKVPTLEELIESCGEDFWSITKRRLPDIGGGKWTVWQYKLGGEIEAEGSTPTEAVANLWLSLNQKS